MGWDGFGKMRKGGDEVRMGVWGQERRMSRGRFGWEDVQEDRSGLLCSVLRIRIQRIRIILPDPDA